MKPSTILYMLAATTIFLVSCGERSRFAEPLLAAEQTAKTRPYDAIVVLEGRKDSLCHTTADSALYELVYAEALRGLDMQITNGEYVSHSADFFRQNGDKGRTARALLQTALCYFDDGKYVDATRKMKEAETIATTFDDQDLHNRLFLSLARINDMTGNFSLSDYYYKLALTAAQHFKHTNRLAMTLNAVAGHYFRLENIDGFNTCMSLCKPLMDSISDINRAAIEANMGCFYMAKGDTAKAKEFFSRSHLMCPDRKSSLFLGDIYAKEGDEKMATIKWYDAINSTDTHIRKAALNHLIASAKAHGNMEEAFYLSHQLNDTYEKDITTATATAIATVQMDFDYRQTAHHDKATTVLLVVGGVVFVGVVIVIFIVIMRRHAKNKELSLSRWNKENVLMKAECVHQLHRLATTGKAAQKADWEALHELVSQHDKPIAVLLENCRNLSAMEMDVAILTRLHFLPSEIATLTASSPQTVTNTRTRLLRKIFDKEGGAKDFDQAINDI